MRIAVIGAGSVGGYFGGRLAQAGEDVMFIARGEHAAAIHENGLRVDSILGDFVVQPAQVASDPAEVGAVDAILVGVKAWQVPQAAAAIQPLIRPDTYVVPLQNGVEAPFQLAQVLGEAHVLGGLCRISSLVAGPGHIRHVGIEPSIAFGEMPGWPGAQAGYPSGRALALQQSFERAGVKAEVPEDILAAMWGKFLFIAAVSGVGALARLPLGVVRSVPETRQMLTQVMEEIVAVAQAQGVNMTASAVPKMLANIDSLPEGVIPSMQRDIMEGRPSELAAQTGAVVRMGRAAGVPVPVNELIYAALLPQEMQARK